MKMTVDQAIERFGKEAINKLIDMQAEPTGRLIYPAFEPHHVGMDEYCVGSVYVDGGKIDAYYYLPADAEDCEFGDIEFIEYTSL